MESGIGEINERVLVCLLVRTVTVRRFWRAKEPDRLVIENGRVTMELTAAAKGSVVSLGDKAVGRELMAAAGVSFQSEFSLAGEVAGKRITVTNRDTRSIGFEKKTNSGQTIGRVRFAGVGGQAIEVVCTITAGETGDRLVRWRIAVQFPESLVLEGVRFPVSSACACRSRPTARMPWCWGPPRAESTGGRRPGSWAGRPGRAAGQPGRPVRLLLRRQRRIVYGRRWMRHGYRKMINTWRGSDSLTLGVVRALF